jgi:hypothetical protein
MLFSQAKFDFCIGMEKSIKTGHPRTAREKNGFDAKDRCRQHHNAG